MNRALRCLGFVLMSIAGTAMAVCCLFAGVGALFWISDATAHWFEVPQYGALFMLGYMVAIIGGLIGAILCREDRA